MMLGYTILFLDGGAEHFSLVATKMLMDANVTVKTLIPSTTHLTQPLDVKFIGGLKRSVAAWFRHNDQVPTAAWIPYVVEVCIEKMTTTAKTAGKDGPLQSAFAAAHLYPLSPGGGWGDADFAPSDRRMSLSASDPRVLAARSMSREDAEAIAARHSTLLTPQTSKELEEAVQRRVQKYATKGIDVTRLTAITSEQHLARALAKEKEKEAHAAGVVQRREEAVQRRAAREEERVAKEAARTVGDTVYKTIKQAQKARASAAAATAGLAAIAAVATPSVRKRKR